MDTDFPNDAGKQTSGNNAGAFTDYADSVKLRRVLNVAKEKGVEYSFVYSACFVVYKNVRELRGIIRRDNMIKAG